MKNRFLMVHVKGLLHSLFWKDRSNTNIFMDLLHDGRHVIDIFFCLLKCLEVFRHLYVLQQMRQTPHTLTSHLLLVLH